MKPKASEPAQHILAEVDIRDVLACNFEVPFTGKLHYCGTRRRLEQQSWGLVSKLAWHSTQLLQLRPKDRIAFERLKAECEALRDEIAESRRHVHAHRESHGC